MCVRVSRGQWRRYKTNIPSRESSQINQNVQLSFLKLVPFLKISLRSLVSESVWLIQHLGPLEGKKLSATNGEAACEYLEGLVL